MRDFFKTVRAWSFTKYVLVGTAAGLADLLVNAALAEGLGVHPLWANAISRPLGGLISFSLNKYWTFRNRGQARTHVQAARFLVVWCGCFLLSEFIIGFYFHFAHLRPILAKMAGESTLGFFSFLVQKFWTFR